MHVRTHACTHARTHVRTRARPTWFTRLKAYHQDKSPQRRQLHPAICRSAHISACPSPPLPPGLFSPSRFLLFSFFFFFFLFSFLPVRRIINRHSPLDSQRTRSPFRLPPLSLSLSLSLSLFLSSSFSVTHK